MTKADKWLKWALLVAGITLALRFIILPFGFNLFESSYPFKAITVEEVQYYEAYCGDAETLDILEIHPRAFGIIHNQRGGAIGVKILKAVGPSTADEKKSPANRTIEEFDKTFRRYKTALKVTPKSGVSFPALQDAVARKHFEQWVSIIYPPGVVYVSEGERGRLIGVDRGLVKYVLNYEK